MGEARRRKLASAAAQIGPPFTISLDADGTPVPRRLQGEMTVSEVLTALEWQAANVARLEAEAEPARRLAEARSYWRRRARRGPPSRRTLRTLATEQETLIVLLQRIGAAMPQVEARFRSASERSSAAVLAAVIAATGAALVAEGSAYGINPMPMPCWDDPGETDGQSPSACKDGRDQLQCARLATQPFDPLHAGRR